MKKKYLNKIKQKNGYIFDDSRRIDVLIKNILDNPDDEAQTFILGDLAKILAKKITKNSLDISNYFAK